MYILLSEKFKVGKLGRLNEDNLLRAEIRKPLLNLNQPSVTRDNIIVFVSLE